MSTLRQRSDVIDALIGGKLYGAPQSRMSKSGATFATAKVRTPMANGENIFINVIAFADAVVIALLALKDGDSVALSGELTPKCWTNKNGETKPALDLVAHNVLTPYDVTRKRKAITEATA
jgi:single-stranded DNA-binding protein